MMYEMNDRLLDTAINESETTKCTSRHGFIRTMERADRKEQQALRLIRNAWTRGKTMDQLQLARQKRYVAHFNSLLYDGYTNLRIYCGYLFIFSAGGCLITMHPLPETFGKKSVYDGKTRVRNVKKYTRFNDEPVYAEAYELSA